MLCLNRFLVPIAEKISDSKQWYDLVWAMKQSVDKNLYELISQFLSC